MLIDVATHGILDDPLNENSVIIDLGANQGEFSAAMIRRFRCKVIAVEPSAEMCERLRKIGGVSVVFGAIAEADGTATFHVSRNAQASTIRPVPGGQYVERSEVPTITLGTLLQREGVARVDLLKVDIEGSEVGLFNSTPDELLRHIPQLSIEFHDFNGMIRHDQADAIEARLECLGFRRIAMSRTNRENVLFYRPAPCRLNWICRVRAHHWTRNWIGFKRWLARRRH